MGNGRSWEDHSSPMRLPKSTTWWMEACLGYCIAPFDPKVLIRNLALQLLSDAREEPTGATATGKEKKNIAIMGLQELVKELNRLLDEKCLIVLDDVSTTAEWDLVESCLQNARRVIVTTREKNIAKHCSGKDTNMYHLKGLKDAAALDLFKKKVFLLNLMSFLCFCMSLFLLYSIL